MMRRVQNWISKVLKQQLKKEETLLVELHVAKELHMTLGDLRKKMTYEELWLWVAYFGLVADERTEVQQKAMRRRR